MTNIFVGADLPISSASFQKFMDDFSCRVPLASISLIQQITNHWLINRPPISSVTDTLPSAAFQKLVPNTSGVYAFFVKCPTLSSDKWFCYYVGMADQSSIRDRMVMHLRNDIRKDYRGCFHQLSECTDVYICTATVPATNQFKEKLVLLEQCLTVELRPVFLLCTAGLNLTTLKSCRASDLVFTLP